MGHSSKRDDMQYLTYDATANPLGSCFQSGTRHQCATDLFIMVPSRAIVR
jgi:hypothetical protein